MLSSAALYVCVLHSSMWRVRVRVVSKMFPRPARFLVGGPTYSFPAPGGVHYRSGYRRSLPVGCILFGLIAATRRHRSDESGVGQATPEPCSALSPAVYCLETLGMRTICTISTCCAQAAAL